MNNVCKANLEQGIMQILVTRLDYLKYLCGTNSHIHK